MHGMFFKVGKVIVRTRSIFSFLGGLWKYSRLAVNILSSGFYPVSRSDRVNVQAIVRGSVERVW